ncbi:hypothetical protein CL652_03275 [bacterium]|nr:hypothetical protein [bacterium]|tara:strand:- start:25242 stop:26123 length:882 start_codon:yes stop_codon:yes gene_type:complete
MWRGSRHSQARISTRDIAKRSTARVKLSRSKVARRRLQLRALKTAIVAVLLVSLVGMASWISFIEALAVKSIRVEGNEEVRTLAIESKMMAATAGASLGLFSKQNTILYPASELESILAFEFPKIATVSIRRELTQQRVVVSITEREPYAQWCRKSECYNLDIEGYVYESTRATSTKLVTFSGGIDESRTKVLRTYIAPEFFAQTRDFIDGLARLNLEATRFFFEEKDARIQFRDGWELRVALDKDLGATLFNLAAILGEYDLRSRLHDILYIDMRFDERVYYKVREFAGEEA